MAVILTRKASKVDLAYVAEERGSEGVRGGLVYQQESIFR